MNKFHHYFTKKRTTTGALLRNVQRFIGKGQRDGEREREIDRAKKKEGKMKVKRSEKEEKKRPHAFKEFKQSIFSTRKRTINRIEMCINRLNGCLSVDVSIRLQEGFHHLTLRDVKYVCVCFFFLFA